MSTLALRGNSCDWLGTDQVSGLVLDLNPLASQKPHVEVNKSRIWKVFYLLCHTATLDWGHHTFSVRGQRANIFWPL